jgi:DNA-binding response OmpR family regulator
VLARKPGTIVSRDRIETELAHSAAEFESNAMEVYVSRIRRKLGHDSIETLRGIGYRLRP